MKLSYMSLFILSLFAIVSLSSMKAQEEYAKFNKTIALGQLKNNTTKTLTLFIGNEKRATIVPGPGKFTRISGNKILSGPTYSGPTYDFEYGDSFSPVPSITLRSENGTDILGTINISMEEIYDTGDITISGNITAEDGTEMAPFKKTFKASQEAPNVKEIGFILDFTFNEPLSKTEVQYHKIS